MNSLRWILMCILFTLYLLCGGGIFMFFEQSHELEQNEIISNLKKDVKEILLQIDRDFYSNSTSKEVIYTLQKAKEDVIMRISDVCNVGNLLQSQTTGFSDIRWNYYNSVFFAFTIITTIGYGALTPATNLSKIFVIIYALIGIPINTILLTNLSKYFARRFVKKRNKIKELNYKQNSYEFFLEILIYLIPGLIVLVFIPSVVFVVLEGWTYLDSVYYSFVTLLTIGFGDYVAAISHGQSFWMLVYKISLIIWIVFGIGYLLMVLGFISKGLTSKHVKLVLEKQINSFSSRKEKLTRDIEYMRRVVNELYFMKIKPVYAESEDSDVETNKSESKRTIRRRSSLPANVRYGFGPSESTTEQFSPEQKKNVTSGRHLSVAGIKLRWASESNLQEIDRELTFKKSGDNEVTPDELLVAVLEGLTEKVMDAVEELKEYDERWRKTLEDTGVYEDNVFFASDDDEYWDELETLKASFNNKAAKKPSDGITWDLNMKSYEDFGFEDDDESLQQVVVENPKPMSRNSSFLNVITGAIRKISSFGKLPSSEASSKNELQNVRKLSSKRNSTFPTEDYFVRNDASKAKFYIDSNPYVQHNIHPMAHENNNNVRQRRIRNSSEDDSRKISKGSRASRASSSASNHGVDVSSECIGTSNRKLSFREPSPFPTRRSLEGTSLADFITALDKVHARLNSVCVSHEDLVRSESMFETNKQKVHRKKSEHSSFGPTKTLSNRRKYATASKPDVLDIMKNYNSIDDTEETKGSRWVTRRKMSLWGTAKKTNKKDSYGIQADGQAVKYRNRSSSIF